MKTHQIESDTTRQSIRLHHDGLLKPKEAADYLGLAESTLAKLRLRGDGPAFCKLGRSVRYKVQGLHQWATERTRRSTSES